MEVKGKDRCAACSRDGEEVRLFLCPICAKKVCAEHSYRRSGKPFCSKPCAEWFFYADEEE